jgi:hypothetical protein
MSVGPRGRVFAPIAGPPMPVLASPRGPVRKPLQVPILPERPHEVRVEPFTGKAPDLVKDRLAQDHAGERFAGKGEE